ncbi:hypothetical protein [Terrarubrum flagellatum]|uniref:hypothetical protein n=1 Tax=Terrirubrum flagellatum TaxID=2895980 RepID=UPI0031455BF5
MTFRAKPVVHEWDLPRIGLRGLSARDRQLFWQGFEKGRRGAPYVKGNGFSRWRPVAGTELNIALYITNRSVGLFVRGLRGVPLSATRVLLGPRKAELETRLAARLDDEVPLLRRLPLASTDTSTWARAYEWLRDAEEDFLAALIAED